MTDASSSNGRSIQIGRYTFNMWQLAFGVLLLVYASIILLTFRDYGITSDETHHVKYGEDIVRWYTSRFQDQSLFQTKNTYLYGGFFDTIAYLSSLLLPLDRYDANHLCNATFGLLGIIAAYRIGAQLGGSAIGFLAALALLLTPRYYGHAFNNPKDIPFAVCYLWALDYLIRCVGAWPNLSRRLLVGTGLTIGLALGVRIGGVLLFAYLVLFLGLKIWQSQKPHPIKSTLVQIGVMAIIAYAVMLMCWPWALTNPLSGPIEAFAKFSQFTEQHPSFFDGRYVLNTHLPRDYAPTWFLLTLPEFALLNLGFGIGLLIWNTWQNERDLRCVMLLSAGLFPIGYAVLMRTPLYDGLRHLLFAVPPLVVFGAVSIGAAMRRKFRFKPIVWTGVAILMGSTAWQMVFLHPNQYTYFNHLIAGGIAKASERYETDYWENSLKQGVRWIENHVPIDKDRRLKIGAFTDNLQYMLDPERFEFAPYPESADFFLGTTRYDRHRKVPGKIVHVIGADAAPILYIIHPDTAYRGDPFFSNSYFMHYRLGEIYEADGRPQKALVEFLKARDMVMQDDALRIFRFKPYLSIGNQYDAMGRYDEALNAYHRALDFAPQNGAIHNNIGIIHARNGDYPEAQKWLRKAIALSPDHFVAHVNLGDIALETGDLDKAQLYYEKARKLSPDDVDLLTRFGKLYYRTGNFRAAEKALHQAQAQKPNDVVILHELALARAQLQHYVGAREAAQRAVDLNPDYLDAYMTLGSILMYQKRYADAIEAFQKAKALNPARADAYSALGMAFFAAGNRGQAKRAFTRALQIDPQNAEALQFLPKTSP